MRISDWSSDVCSSDVWHFSDLEDRGHWIPAFAGMTIKSSGRSRAQLLMRNLLVLLLSLCTLAAADAVAREPVRMLVFTKTAGFRHDSIPAAVEPLRALGDGTGWEVGHGDRKSK